MKRDQRIELRASVDERAAWEAAADAAGISLSDWVRARCAVTPPKKLTQKQRAIQEIERGLSRLKK